MFPLWQVFSPLAPVLQMTVGGQERKATIGCCRLVDKLHSGFRRGSARFSTVAGDTGADHVLPGVFAAPITGHDVVQGKLFGFLAAVLAGVPVTVEDLGTGELRLQLRAFDKAMQPDYRW